MQNILGLSLRGVMYLEQQGDLVGIRDESGRVRFKLKEVKELHKARKAKREEVAILDLDDTGALYVREDGEYDQGEQAEVLRFKRECELKERELVLREREVTARESQLQLLKKEVPKAVRALERVSWASVAAAATGVLPESAREKLLSEFAGALGDLTQSLAGVAGSETPAKETTPP